MYEATPQKQQQQRQRQQPKKILVVSAHPEPQSLNATLTTVAVEHLRAAGHEVRVSDLYAMKWKAGLDADDYLDHAPDRRLKVLTAAGQATLAGRLSPDIAAEQEKLLWSDAVILQFPMWWFSVPAILKGWMDRVFTNEFCDGSTVPPPYSEGALGGRRALVSVTLGARESSFSDRGIHGPLSDVLFPLQHGLFWFTGMSPLEPFAVYGCNELPEERYEEAKQAYIRRLDGLFTDEPVPFRTLTGGDYGRDLRLLPGVEEPGSGGLQLHVRPAG
ncbi:NAD(P)H-dependent oxidoreductase [Streptomyces hesseae]|uniref:NAD(P)H-dependent oxidoreductase n=1 Tax=Streptomyces hesseae TaxID=3075519 RepID=A0ABU2SJL6_9ACTN|nr:NAD(P)H-dependent oxidoreductase [Streptomyces sp. DSM 40473]MDT0448109.1 NAD(P)H-dependent oxidoreductase [Streptomyces sp. DSM 40473]